ncbi:MAG: choice-of-anchor Q domain-containing protein [Thermomicrobiales bacterium]
MVGVRAGRGLATSGRAAHLARRARDASLGGGLLITGTQSQMIVNSTITGNTAASGGGIDNQGALAITNSTISANHASVTDGGGIKAESRGVGVTVTNTIIADNSCITPNDDVSGTFTSGGHNLIGFTGISIGFDAALGDLLNPPSSGVSPTLTDNGGPTLTLALQNGSPAIGAVSRGFPIFTIGAFEYRLAQSISVASSNAPIVVGGTTQFTATVTFADTTTQDITAAANRSTGDSAKATVVSGFTSMTPGLVTGAGAGTTSVSARFGSVQGSGSVTVTIPTPAITGLTPSTVTTTSGTIALTVTGSGFVPSSVVHFRKPDCFGHRTDDGLHLQYTGTGDDPRRRPDDDRHGKHHRRQSASRRRIERAATDADAGVGNPPGVVRLPADDNGGRQPSIDSHGERQPRQYRHRR